MSKELRPVGTEYWYEYPVNNAENSHGEFGKQMKFLYIVTEHGKVMRWKGDEIGEMAEHVVAIKSMSRWAGSCIIEPCPTCGKIRYVYNDFTEWKEDLCQR